MIYNIATHDCTALDRFCARVVADPALADRLSVIEDPVSFVDRLVACAATEGIAVTADAVRAEIRPDPLGVTRWTAEPVVGSAWPPASWLPVRVSELNGRFFIDWAHFGPRPLTEPFFEDSIRRAITRPFNRVFRYRTPIEDGRGPSSQTPSLSPSGFIFHMSRCGSTLVAQMLAASASNIVISESAPLDAVVQINAASSDVSQDRRVSLLTAMIAAYGRKRSGSERHYFIKLDSWHALALTLFRRAFPAVPWLFLYRDPVEVMVSQWRQRGSQMIRELVSPSLYGLDGAGRMSIDEYTAHVLARICEAAADNLAEGGGLPVDYRELPDALFTKILPHFGIAVSARDRDTMNLAARADAKAPSFTFENDSEAKQRQATETIRSLAERHLGGVYRRLEQLRAGAPRR